MSDLGEFLAGLYAEEWSAPRDRDDPTYQGLVEAVTIRCPHCLDDGIVCENHPGYPWEVTVEGHSADCGAPGMPCGYCCSPIPENGTESIVLAFTPDWKRA